MKQVIQKILLLVAVLTVTGHSIIPHYHHDESPATIQHYDHEEEQAGDLDHHDEHNDDHHNIFSFGQLDENFVPVKWQRANAEPSIYYLITPAITHELNLYKARPKIIVGYYREFPPPDNYSLHLFSRPPPAC